MKSYLRKMFAVEGTPNEIMSDNGPPFNGKEFNGFPAGLGIKPQLHHQTIHKVMASLKKKSRLKRLLEKAIATGRSFQEALSGLSASPLGNGLPSLAGRQSWQLSP